MLPQYPDILALAHRAGVGEPAWFDEAGVPRYAPFHPSLLGVYDELAVLAEVTCASCNKTILVGLGRGRIELGTQGGFVRNDLASVIALAKAWGDPPRHNLPLGGRCAGETMLCRDVRVVETWEMGDDFEWQRVVMPGRCGSPAQNTAARAWTEPG